jgi:hypothetical protein
MNVMCCIVGYKLIDRSEEPAAFIFTVDGWKKYICWIVGKFLRLHGFSSQKTVFLIPTTIQTSSLITFVLYIPVLYLKGYISVKYLISRTVDIVAYMNLKVAGRQAKYECKHHIWHKWGVFISFLHVTWSAFWPFELF